MTGYYIPELYRFLDELAANNDRQWFAQNKSRYDDLRDRWLADIDRLISLMSVWEPDLAGQTAKSSAYRIYRDTRFSSDKTPYKTFFSALISPWGRRTERAAYYVETGIARSYDQGLYAGVWCCDAPTLRKLRHAIVDNIEEWDSIVNAPEMLRYFPDWCSSTLKTMPKGWDRNHPQAQYLRMTNYGKFMPCPREFFSDPSWPEKAAEMLHVLKPMVDFLNYSIDE